MQRPAGYGPPPPPPGACYGHPGRPAGMPPPAVYAGGPPWYSAALLPAILCPLMPKGPCATKNKYRPRVVILAAHQLPRKPEEFQRHSKVTLKVTFPGFLQSDSKVTFCLRKNHFRVTLIIDLLMGLFRWAVFRHGGGGRKQPIKQPTEMPTSTMVLMGRFPLLMGRFRPEWGVSPISS